MARLSLVQPPREGTRLFRRAIVLWPGNEKLASRWLGAVNYLRTQSRKGWLADEKARKVV